MILRIIVAPFVLGIILTAYIYFSFRRTYHFIKYGGEWINYDRDDRITIQDIYQKLKDNDKHP